MVLTFKRAALMVLAAATTVSAQQGRGSGLPSIGDMRPLLYGFALACVDCQPGGARGRGGRGSGGPPPVWSYTTYPQVMAVAPGSAAEAAGIREGDVLVSIDGLSVLTDPGARRFAAATKGEEVRLAFERNSKPISFAFTLGEAPVTRSGGRQVIANGYIALNGRLTNPSGDLKMEVWSDEPIYPTEAEGVFMLRIGTSTIVKFSVKPDADSTAGRGRGGAAKKPDSDR